MSKNSIKVYSLGCNHEWYELKRLAKSQNLKTDIKLMFEKDWEAFQLETLGFYDKEISMISYYNGTTLIGLEYYKENWPKINIPSFSLKKFLKNIDNSKKYIEWEIKINENIDKIIIELDFSLCPRTCENFWQISTDHKTLSYVNSCFYRVAPNLFVEGGIIENDMKSIYFDYFPDENYRYAHNAAGVIGMSKLPSGNGTSFYITLKPIKYFDGKFTAFGRVVQGMDVIEKISQLRTVNQKIVEAPKIISSKDYFHAKLVDKLEQSNSFRDLANELLKFL